MPEGKIRKYSMTRIASIFNVSRPTVYRWFTERWINGTKENGKWYFDAQDVDIIIELGKQFCPHLEMKEWPRYLNWAKKNKLIDFSVIKEENECKEEGQTYKDKKNKEE